MIQIDHSALIIVDMENYFFHPDGGWGRKQQKEDPEFKVDREFLASIIPDVKRLADAFREAHRPVIYIAHVLKTDYSDAEFPHNPLYHEVSLAEDSWGSRIVEELAPHEGEIKVIKKGFNGFHNTPLAEMLRHLEVTDCVVAGVTTGACVSRTIKGGLENRFNMYVVEDATAERTKELHEAAIHSLSEEIAGVTSVGEMIHLFSQ